MKTSHTTGIALMVAALAVSTTGCYSLFDPGSTELQTKMTWEQDLPDIDPIDSSRRIVYLSYRDASGGDLPNLRDDITYALKECGYEVTRNVADAWYSLEIRVRYFGEQRSETSGSGAVGALAGGVAGAVGGVAIGDSTRSTVAGGAIGALAGGVAGNIIDKHNPIRTYDFVLEVACGERIPAGFTEKTLGMGSSNWSHGNQQSVEGGAKSTSSHTYEDKSTDLARKREIYKHKNKLTISVAKRNLTADEAYNAAIGRLVRAFGGIMPEVDPETPVVTPAVALKQIEK